jgi:ABC-type lipoprotein export system ATPase subunit
LKKEYLLNLNSHRLVESQKNIISFSHSGEFYLHQGDLLFIVGENGIGKTSFLNFLYNFIGHSNDLKREFHIVRIPQRYDFFDYNGRTIYDFYINYFTKDSLIGRFVSTEDVKSKLIYFIELFPDLKLIMIRKNHDNSNFELDWFLKNKLEKFSGGQKRILYIIRAILEIEYLFLVSEKSNTFFNKTTLLLMDEPFNDVSIGNIKNIVNIINNLKKFYPDLITIFVSHFQFINNINRVVKIFREDGGVKLKEISDQDNFNFYSKTNNCF